MNNQRTDMIPDFIVTVFVAVIVLVYAYICGGK